MKLLFWKKKGPPPLPDYEPLRVPPPELEGWELIAWQFKEIGESFKRTRETFKRITMEK